MSIDGIMVSALVYELKNKIVGLNINKIYEHEDEEIIFFIGKYKLLISANSVYPRLHFIESNDNNPNEAPMFCMVLRKYIQNSRIVNIYQHEFDRVIAFDIEKHNDLIGNCICKLIFEIMGRYSNIILLNQDNIIIDAIKHIDSNKSSVRQIIPKIKYELPIGKSNPLRISNNSNINNSCNKFCDEFNGISALIQKEIQFRVNKYHNINAYDVFLNMISNIKNNIYDCQIAFDDKNNKTILSAINLEQYDYKKKYRSATEAVELFYREKSKKDFLRRKTHDLSRTVYQLKKKYESKLINQQKDMQQTENKDTLRLYGELIVANLYHIKPYSEFFVAKNYYDNDNEIEIHLDKNLSASQNANNYFKQYNYQKRKQIALAEQINKNKLELEYIKSVEQNLFLCENIDDIDAIKQELIQEKIIKKHVGIKNKKNKIIDTKKTIPYIVSKDGFYIYFGKNNIQNDYVTFKVASSKDIWLHAKNIPGSHVIIKLNNRDITEETLLEAANVCAKYSANNMTIDKILVDYTERRYVKKINGAKFGMVTYSNYKTVTVSKV
jgi:predicted ribosome quality control (RQC) complex YloA/Tae2 family protein